MGLSSLDVDTTAEEGFAPGRGTPSTEYEAAKQAAGIPTENQPRSLNIGRDRGIGGLLGGQVYAARFRLDAISAQLLDPLSDLLGKHKYLFRGDQPSSLDCLAPWPHSWRRSWFSGASASLPSHHCTSSTLCTTWAPIPPWLATDVYLHSRAATTTAASYPHLSVIGIIIAIVQSCIYIRKNRHVPPCNVCPASVY